MSRDHEKGRAQRFVRYEVRRERKLERPPEVEEHLGLDRARIAAMGYALDGPTGEPSFYTGRVRVLKVIRCESVAGTTSIEGCIDELDEAGIATFLNSVELPKAR